MTQGVSLKDGILQQTNAPAQPLHFVSKPQQLSQTFVLPAVAVLALARLLVLKDSLTSSVSTGVVIKLDVTDVRMLPGRLALRSLVRKNDFLVNGVVWNSFTCVNASTHCMNTVSYAQRQLWQK